ncbi:MAG: FecR family protein [Candidatus Methylacidiphilales bacterium]
MKENEIIEIIAKFFANEASNLEKEALTAWRKSDEKNEIYFKEFEKIWDNSIDGSEAIDTNGAWENVAPKLTTKAPIIRLNFLAKIAAAFIFVLGFSILISRVYFNESQLVAFTSNTDKQQINLPDGSAVWLNSHSKLTYQEADNERKLTLNGEAFFEVVKNPSKPFIIKSKNAVTKVLGTSFNLIAFDSSSSVKLSVSTGKVNFKSNKTNANQILTALESAVIDEKGNNNKLSQFDINEIIWKENKLVFNNLPLNEALADIAHYYGVQISTDNELLNNCHITSQFENATLVNVLDNVSKILSITYTKKNNQIVFSGKGCN